MRLKGKTVLVTGAGTGIGRATALRMAQEPSLPPTTAGSSS